MFAVFFKKKKEIGLGKVHIYLAALLSFFRSGFKLGSLPPECPGERMLKLMVSHLCLRVQSQTGAIAVKLKTTFMSL